MGKDAPEFDQLQHNLDRYQLSRLKIAINQQEETNPPLRIRSSILSRIQAEKTPRVRLSLAWGVLLPALILIFWGVFQPGVVMSWEVKSGSWKSYRIYRAEGEPAAFKLIDELPSSTISAGFKYRDVTILPGKSYYYQVEAVNQNGNVAYSPPIKSNAIDTIVIWTSVFVMAIFSYWVILVTLGNLVMPFENRIFQ